MARYRVEQLADAGGTSVRNVRAYRERGLLGPPTLVGRTGWYDEAALARLRLITQLLDRGYTTGNIGELLSAWEANRPLGDILGIADVVTRRRTTDEPRVVPLAGLAVLFGAELDKALPRLAELGLLEADDEAGADHYRLPRPSLVAAIAEFIKLGLPAPVVFDLGAQMLMHLDALAGSLVHTANETLYAHADQPATLAEFDQQASRLLELAAEAVAGVFDWCLQRQLVAELGRSVEGRYLVPEVVG